MAHAGPAAVEEATAGAVALQRMKLERRLAYLATLGNNAPFIGLLGTVIGVVQAFAALGEANKAPVAQATSQALAPAQVMLSISEALVATAVGLAVALPAVAFNNLFQRLIKGTLANTDALTRILLAHLKSEPLPEGAFAPASPPPVVNKRPAKAASAKATPVKGKKGEPAPKPAAEEEEEESDRDEEEG
jgi:biopolymer transport protein ExbB